MVRDALWPGEAGHNAPHHEDRGHPARLLRRFAADERGNIAIMSAASVLLVIACTALGIDVGSIFADKRRAQSAADLAAIVAASDLDNASRAAAATVENNETRATLSGGVAVALSDDRTLADVLDRADAALYRAKLNGRDRIELDAAANSIRVVRDIAS